MLYLQTSVTPGVIHVYIFAVCVCVCVCVCACVRACLPGWQQVLVGLGGDDEPASY